MSQEMKKRKLFFLHHFHDSIMKPVTQLEKIILQISYYIKNTKNTYFSFLLKFDFNLSTCSFPVKVNLPLSLRKGKFCPLS